MGAAPRAVGGLAIAGIDELRRQLEPAVFNRTFRIAHRRAAAKVKSESREIVPGKTFDRSIRDQLLPSGLGAVVFTNADAGESIHEGRRQGEQVPVKALKRWILTYGLAGRVSVKTRRVSRAKAARPSFDDVNDLAHTVQQQIREHGTAAIRFFADALPASARDVERYWREALQDSVKHFAGKRRVA